MGGPDVSQGTVEITTPVKAGICLTVPVDGLAKVLCGMLGLPYVTFSLI